MVNYRAIWTGLFGLALYSLGTFIMVADELISVALYMAPPQTYPYPLLGTFAIWDAWIIAYSAIAVSELTAIISFYKTMKAK